MSALVPSRSLATIGNDAAPSMSNTGEVILIHIVPIGRGRWDAYLGSEKVAFGKSDPGFATCRALKPRGFTGLIQIWHRGAAYPSMCIEIERGAGLTVRENEKSGPKFAPWKPFDPTQRAGMPIARHPSEQGAASA